MIFKNDKVYTNLGHPKRNLRKVVLPLLSVLIAGTLGTHLLNFSFAATISNNPYGAIDYCGLVNNQTVIYGWANDENAPAGAYPNVSISAGVQSENVATNVAGYRDAQINAYIKKTYPGQPTSSVYGFVAKFAGLYKGGHYVVGGTAINYGAGVNAAMILNESNTEDGHAVNGFVGGVIPAACLATALAPPPAGPTPTPTPTPVTTPAPKKTTTTIPRSTSTPVAATPAPGPGSNADGTVAAGTTGASITIPADNASTVHIAYGSDPAALSQSTTDQAVSGDSTTIDLTGLQSKTTYTYQIARTNANGTTTSAPATFTTSGYTIAITFTDKNKKPVSGIKATLNDSANTPGTSDKKGLLSFKNLDRGSYSVTFTYQGHKHVLSYDTSSLTDPSNASKPALLADSIDVSQLTASSQVPAKATKKSGNVGIVIVVIVLILALIGGIVWFLLFMRRKKSGTTDSYTVTPTGTPDIIDQQMNQHFHDNPTPLPIVGEAPHKNESLREMVVKSMHEEALKRQQQEQLPQPGVALPPAPNQQPPAGPPAPPLQ